ncbi:hypothetical protein ACIGO6_16600 [Streptomyces sp. NPDC053750]|uniref:hypothetical protein n=1 Tax=Streptomyces sp. NPDC053750 TaxID=3365714 RepID=UPI0037D1C4D9
MPIRTRIRRLGGAAALVATCALALVGCGDGSTGGPQADARPATATAAQSSSPTHTPSPTTVTLPDHTGRDVGGAVLAAKAAHIDYTVQLQGTGRQASAWDLDEEVCEQTDGPGGVTFTVPRDGRDCDGRLLDPLPTPAPESAEPQDTGTGGTATAGTTSGGTGGGTGACELTSPAGNCYADGQFCAKKHRGLSTHGRGGEYLTCEPDASGTWRWSDGVTG